MISLPPLRRNRDGAFSLLELLVVITIIGILASMLLPAGHQVTKSMRKVQAQKTATELRTAMSNYYAEYKRFPKISGSSTTASGDVEISTAGSTGIITALMGVPGNKTTEELNRRGISFFTSKKAKTAGSAGIWPEGGNHALYDPWGGYYYIAFDSNYDNAIEVPSRTGSGTEEVYSSVAVWSYGPDKQLGSGGSSKGKNDDIYAY